ncbi:MAG TPA: LPS assembly protein LptD [Steroidobacteraceae bacterium]
MPRSRPVLISVVSLGAVAPSVWADDLPSCGALPGSTLVALNSPAAPANLPLLAAAAPPSPPTAPGATPSATAPARPRSESRSFKEQGIDADSDTLTFSLDGDAIFKGNVVVKQGDRTIKADELDYNRKTGAIKTQGHIDYIDSLIHVTGSGGDYSPEGGAEFKDAQFELRQRSARGSADTMQLTPEGIINLNGVRFTTCPASDQSWQLRATNISLDTRARVGTGHDARIDLGDVPIMYLPWLSFPLGNERKSGFLFPSLGQSSRSGAQLSVPYYWNIAPNADFTFEPDYYSRRGVDVGGDLRWMTQSEHSELTWNYLPDDSVYGNSRSRVRFQNTTELPGNFRFSVDATNLSDSQYFEDFAQSPEGTSTAFVERRATLSYRDEHWRVDAEAQQYQTIDSTLATTDRPYARAPWVSASADYGFGPDQLVRYGFESEVVNFERSTGITGWRADLMPSASLNVDGPGYFVRPAVAWRGTQYQLDDVPLGQDKSPSRTLPIASFDTGLFFERDPDSRGHKITLEPRLLYLYVPYRQQDNLPVFDTALPDLNLVELFRTNRYVGADRMGDANQVSMGVTSRWLDAQDGRQFVSATLGQTYYFQTPRVTLPGEPPPTSNKSDLVGQLTLSAFKNWNAELGLQWDPTNSQTQREEVSVQYRPSGEQVVNLAYRYQRDLLEQADISAVWPINQHWNVFARGVYSLKDSEAIERFAGLEYKASCWKVRFLARRFVASRPVGTNATGQQDTGFFLQLELTGLASVGSAADAFLTEAIRGYSRPTEPGLSKTAGL